MRQIYNYRGGPGMLAWALHRLTGLGVVAFLALHIFDIFLVGFGPQVFTFFLFLYRAWPFRILEVFLLFGLLYHALNGLRIILLDFWPATARFHKEMWYVQMIVFLVVFIPLGILMTIPIISELFGV